MTQLGSVNVMVRDMNASVEFYTGVLGLQVDRDRSNPPAFTLLRAANCMIILQDAGGADVGACGHVELAFEVDDLGDIRQKLGDRAIVQQMGWGRAIETTDPNGTRLNFYTMEKPRRRESR